VNASLDLLASGRKVAEVAQLLGISDRTIMSGVANTSSIQGSCPA
jgi:DNA-binding NarL/FixJ family response regulator